MKKTLLFVISLLFTNILLYSQGSYAPAVGYDGTTAIKSDSSVITGWATGIEINRGYVNISDKSYAYNGSNLATYGVPSVALSTNSGIVSLGDSGRATLTFDRPIINGAGPDFAIFENGFFNGPPNAFLELGFTEVSSDGIHFVRFPAVTEVPTTTQIGSFAAMDASYLHNFAGKYTSGYGTPFDLDDVKDSANLDVSNIRFVRIVDAIGNVNTTYSVSRDSEGNIVNDPFPTAFNSSGFDLDGVAIINGGDPYNLSTFNELTLEADTFWNPGVSGSFQSGLLAFPYHASSYSWDGFTYSNKTDNTTGTYENQYSAVTGGGMDAGTTGGTNYVVSYVSSDWNTFTPIPDTLTFSDGLSHALSGFYVTNSTYAYYTMKNGSLYSKVFGGEDGRDPDWFKLFIWGEKADGSLTDSVAFYLADYRFEPDTLDYIVNDWRWVDLSSLGIVEKICFSLASSDAGAYGINTPTYFCMDNITVIPDAVGPTVAQPIADISVSENATASVIDISNTFADEDGNSSLITKAILSNTNESLVTASIDGNELTLTYATDAFGEAVVVVQGLSNAVAVTDTFTVTVSEVTALDDQTENVNMILYPNPSDGLFRISTAGDRAVSVVVLDLSGRTVYSNATYSPDATIDLTREPSGTYLVKITTESATAHYYYIKQ